MKAFTVILTSLQVDYIATVQGLQAPPSNTIAGLHSHDRQQYVGGRVQLCQDRRLHTGSSQGNAHVYLHRPSPQHQYQLGSLVLECGKELHNCLTPENAIHTLCQADKYGINSLRSTCLSSIRDNFPAVEKSPCFATLKSENIELYIDTLELEKTLGSGNPPSAKRARM